MKLKRILSFIMAVTVLTAIIPFGTFTANAETVGGSCGYDATWSYDTSTYTLTISGTGSMNNYSKSSYNSTYVTTAPWKSYYQIVKTVVVEDGITSIGDYVFYGCTGLTSITIPNSVTSIGMNVFLKCTGLTSIIIPNSVTSIGGSAFRGCTGLKTVYYCGTEEEWNKISIGSSNDDLTSADRNYHLYNNEWLIRTPPTCTVQGYTTYTCSVCGESYVDNYTYMPCGENCGFIIKDNTLYIYGNGETSNYKTRTAVPWYDYADQITEIQIDSGINKIGNYAFYCCNNLNTVTIRNRDMDFGKYVFDASNKDIKILAKIGGSIESYC